MARLFEIRDVGTTDDWYTPEWVFDGLGLTFDLDVAAPEGGLEWVPAREYYTESDDGLSQPWFGLVWCNPPYSTPAAWCYKWADYPEGLILLRADLSTGGPYVAFETAHAMWVPKRRLSFVNGFGGQSSSVTFSSVLLGRGGRAVEAMERLADKYGGATRRLL